MSYHDKYLKYKQKYLILKNQLGGGLHEKYMKLLDTKIVFEYLDHQVNGTIIAIGDGDKDTYIINKNYDKYKFKNNFYYNIIVEFNSKELEELKNSSYNENIFGIHLLSIIDNDNSNSNINNIYRIYNINSNIFINYGESNQTTLNKFLTKEIKEIILDLLDIIKNERSLIEENNVINNKIFDNIMIIKKIIDTHTIIYSNKIKEYLENILTAKNGKTIDSNIKNIEEIIKYI